MLQNHCFYKVFRGLDAEESGAERGGFENHCFYKVSMACNLSRDVDFTLDFIGSREGVDHVVPARGETDHERV